MADNPGPEQKGLPGVLGWAAGKVVYDTQNPDMDNKDAFNDYSARLIKPLSLRTIDLDDYFPQETIDALFEKADLPLRDGCGEKVNAAA